MVRQGKLSEVDSLSELGIYGTFLRRGEEVLFNKEAGHLVRTKVCFNPEPVLRAISRPCLLLCLPLVELVSPGHMKLCGISSGYQAALPFL